MVLLSCSGTGGIYAKLANEVAQYNCAQVSPTHNSRRYDLLHVVNKRIITNALIEEISNGKSAWVRRCGEPLIGDWRFRIRSKEAFRDLERCLERLCPKSGRLVSRSLP